MYAGVPNAFARRRRRRELARLGDGSSALGSLSRCAMPKSTIFTSPRLRQEHVRRLDVAMHDAALVHVREAARDLRADVQRPPRATKRASLAESPESTDASGSRRRARARGTSRRRSSRNREAGRCSGATSSPSTRASRSSCAANGDVGAMVDFSALIATTRPSGSCTAR